MTEEAGEKHNRHSIREVKHYVDDGGREISEFVPVFGKNKEDSVLNGLAMFQVRAQHPATGQVMSQNMRLEFEYPKGTALKKAFEMFDEIANKRLEEYKQEQQDKSRVVGAKTVPPIVGADGKPI